MADLKKGDFVRYLGGDPQCGGDLTIGKVYEIEGPGIDREPYFINDSGVSWHVAEDCNNTRCFVKVFDDFEDGQDAVHQPSHYTQGKFETIEIIEEITQGYDDGFVAHCAGTAIKYIARAPFKHETPLEDLRKAARYLDFAIARIEGSGE